MNKQAGFSTLIIMIGLAALSVYVFADYACYSENDDPEAPVSIIDWASGFISYEDNAP